MLKCGRAEDLDKGMKLFSYIPSYATFLAFLGGLSPPSLLLFTLMRVFKVQ